MSATSTATRPSERSAGRGWLPSLVPDLGAIALLLGLTLLFFWRVISPNPANRMSFQEGDFVEQFYAFAYFRAQELAAGRLPTWNPYVYGGHPFAADVQSAVFYPLSWITNLVGIPRGYPFIMLELEAIGHFFLASVFGYLLGRRIVRHIGASLLIGLVYAFGGYLTSYPSQQLSLLEVHTWLPLIVLGVHLATEPGRGVADRIFWTAATGLAFGVSTLAGHPQSSAYVVYGTAAYWLFRVACLGYDGELRKGGSRLAAIATGAYLPIGMLVAAVQLLPTAELIRVSTRADLSYEFTWWGFPLQDIIQLLVPSVVSVYSPMYVGILPLALAVGAALWLRKREVAFWSALAIVALAISFGGHTFIYSFLYNLGPGFASFRHHERSIVLFSLAMAILAGYGALVLLRLVPERSLRRLWRIEPTWISFGGLVLAGYALLLVFALSRIAEGKLDELAARTAFLVLNLAALTGLLFLRRVLLGRHGEPGEPARYALPLLSTLACALVVFDLFSVNWKNNLAPVLPGDHYAPTPITETLRERIGLWRAHNEFQLPLNYGDVYGIEDTGGASPLQVARYAELRQELPRERFFELMAVKYLVTWEGGPPGGTRLAEHRPEPETDPDKVIYLYEMPEPPDRYRLLGDVIVADDARALDVLASSEFDPGRQVVLPNAPAVELRGEPVGSVTVLERVSNRLSLAVTTDRPAILVMAELAYPGWQASVDGVPTEVLQANYAHRAIVVPQGEHRVELVFDPLSLKIGTAISGVTLLLVLATLLVTYNLVRRSPDAALLRRQID